VTKRKALLNDLIIPVLTIHCNLLHNILLWSEDCGKNMERSQDWMDEEDIPKKRQGGLSHMPKKSSSSVRIYYPRFNKQEIIERSRKGLNELGRNLPLVLVVLFGSYAKGNYTAASDIDLLLVYEGQEREDAYALARKALSIPNLELHIYTKAQFEQARQTIEAMTKDGIILYGDAPILPKSEFLFSRECLPTVMPNSFRHLTRP